MTRKKAGAAERRSASMKAVPENVQSGTEAIVSRPDGYYWVAPDGRQEVGPFRTMAQALADMEAADGESPEPGETLEEAESELGLADWIDPDTGGLSEGLSSPRLDGN